MRRKRRRRRRRHKRVCGDNAASRELRKTVSLTQLDRTRAPLYSALLPLSATACGETRRQRLSLFLIPPTALTQPFPSALPPALVPLSRTASFSLLGDLHALAGRQTERLSTYASVKKRGRKKERRVVVQSAQGGCSYSQSLPPVQ